MRATGSFAGSIPSTNTCNSKIRLDRSVATAMGRRGAPSQWGARLIDGRVPRCLPLGGGVQPPQGGETAAAFAEGPRHGLVPLPDAALRASGHLHK